MNEEAPSDAFEAAYHEAYARWIAAVGEDIGGIAWDVLTDPSLGGRFTAHDWVVLVRVGENVLDRRSHEVSPEMRATLDNDPEFVTALTGLMSLMNDRFEEEHPESLDEIDVKIAEAEEEAARLEEELAKGTERQAWMLAETERVKEETRRIKAETARLNAKVDRHEQSHRGLFAGWTTRLWRRKQVAPGVRINLSKSGPSLTLGPKGAHVTYGPRGKTETIGIPGTGAYVQRRTPKS